MESTFETYNTEKASKLLGFLQEGVQLLPERLQTWVQSRAGNAITIFEPAMNLLARCCLTKKPKVPSRSALLRFMQIIHAYTKSQTSGELLQEPQQWTAEQIIAAAKWAGLEQNAKWHGQLGIVLMDCGMHEAAKTQFEYAVEKKPESASSKWKLGWACALSHDFSRALEILENIGNDSFEDIKSGEKDRIIFNSYVLEGECYRQMSCLMFARKEDEEARLTELKAIEVLRKAALYPSSVDTNALGFYALIANRRARYTEARALADPRNPPADNAFLIYNEIMDTLHQLSNTHETGYAESETNINCSKLTGYMRRDRTDTFFVGASSAAYKTGSLEWLAGQYEVAISTAKRDMQLAVATDLGLNLATLYSYMPHRYEEALELWTKVCANLRHAPAHQGDTSRSRRSVVNAIGQFCLNRALESEETSSQFIAILERLVEVHAEDYDTSIYASFFQPRLMESCLARWYFNKGDTERAFDLLRPSVAEGLAILSDDDPENDWIGFLLFNSIFAAVQDDTNFQAAQSATFQNRALACNGCFSTFSAESSIYRCRVCMAVEFCESCHRILMEGKLSLYPTDVCNARHEFFSQPPMHNMSSLEPGYVLIDGKKITVDVWKNRVKQIWGL